jgi:ligand-binding sensor domain-containing protein
MRKLVIAAIALPVTLHAGTGIFVAVRVRHSLTQTRSRLAEESRLAFDLSPITHRDNPGFEPLPTPASYTTGTIFHGQLYLAGPGGLAEFPTIMISPRLFRAGLDLPPAPIVRMAVGTLRGVGHSELILATHGQGILLYDGSSLRQLLPRLKSAQDVTAILPLTSGDLLIGTRQLGLLLYDGKTLTPFHANLSNLAITALAGDAGDLWIGTRNRGLFHWHAGQLDTFDTASGLPDQQIESLALSAGKVFAGTPLGIAEFIAGRPSRTLAPGLFAHSLATDGATLTVASIDQGIHELPLAEGRAARTSLSLEPLEARDLIVIGKDLLAVTPAGLSRRQPSGDWQPILTASASTLADSNISALSFASDGRLWIGYFDHGLDILTAPNSDVNSKTQHIENDQVFCINRIVSDPTRNTIDVATANGLVLFDSTGHPRQTLRRRDGLIADQVSDIALTRNGLALATPAGITFLDATGPHSLYAFHGLVNNHVYALASDPTSTRLLAGTLGGVSLLNDDIVHTNLTTANSGLNQNWITAIVPISEDSTPSFFLGTYGSGVMQLDSSGRITAMEGATLPSEINPNAMLVTAQHVFAGTLGDGLLVYQRSTRHWTRITAGLPSLNVTALAERDGQLYIGTENGIVHIAESRLTP